MKTKLSYYIVVFNEGFGKHEIQDFKTLKALKNGIKRLLDVKSNSFEVRVRYKMMPTTYRGHWNNDWEIWHYDHSTDGASTFNLRRNRWYKQLRRIERQLRPIMLKYNFTK